MLQIKIDIDSNILYKTKKGIQKSGKFSKYFVKHGNLRGLKNEPDTGLLSIFQAIRRFGNGVTIHGFDFYQESDGFVTCYYREEQKDSNKKHLEDKYWLENKKKGFTSEDAATVKNEIITELVEEYNLKILKNEI